MIAMADLLCSFCGNPHAPGGLMIGVSNGAFICDVCVPIAADTVAEHNAARRLEATWKKKGLGLFPTFGKAGQPIPDCDSRFGEAPNIGQGSIHEDGSTSARLLDPSIVREPGQTAFETFWALAALEQGNTMVAWKWAELPPAPRRVWARVEAESRAAPPAGERRDPVVEAVREDLLRRSQAGIAKYGTTLTRTDIDLRGWVRHALEEVLDLANYLKRTEMELEARAPERPAPTCSSDLPSLLRQRVEERFRELYPVTHPTRDAEMRETPEWQAADALEPLTAAASGEGAC